MRYVARNKKYTNLGEESTQCDHLKDQDDEIKIGLWEISAKQCTDGFSLISHSVVQQLFCLHDSTLTCACVCINIQILFLCFTECVVKIFIVVMSKWVTVSH
jgi:hypothetical protein